MSRVLEDVRVLAVEQYGAGPFGSAQLAQLGATVIKIENPATGGDIGRYVEPYAAGTDSLFFETFNSSKKSILLDIRSADGRAVFTDLVAGADAVYSNLRGDVPARLGLMYDDLRVHNPKIVCCSLSAFGMTGPLSNLPGYDGDIQAYAGWSSLNGDPGTPPRRTGMSLVDYSAGYIGALTLMCGIHAARRDGVGMDCDISLFDTAMNMLTYLATWNLTEGYVPERYSRAGHPSRVPFQTFRTADGWINIGANKEDMWGRLVEVVDDDRLRDQRFHTFAGRLEAREEVEAILDDALSTRTVAAWVELLHAARVPCGPVLDVPDALATDQVKARQLIAESVHPRFGVVRQVRTPVRVGEIASEVIPRAPQLGEHTFEVLTEDLGYSTDDIVRLAKNGAFGPDRAPDWLVRRTG